MADLSHTHIFNPKWPPHAKFHTGQTLAFSPLLSFMTIWLAWSRTSDYRVSLIAVVSFDALYWISQNLAILYPETAVFDPDTRSVYPWHTWTGGDRRGYPACDCVCFVMGRQP